MKSQTPLKKSTTLGEKPKPKLSQQFILKIIDLEQKCRRTHSQQYILELVKCYSKVIEHYNSVQDNMGIYFVEKMQTLLASQKTIEIIDKTQEQLTASMNASDAMEGMDKERDVKGKVGEGVKYDLESKKKERSKMVKMFIEIKKTRKRANAANILNQYYKECLTNNQLVHKELELQRMELEERLKVVYKSSKVQKGDESRSEKTLNDSTSESIYIN